MSTYTGVSNFQKTVRFFWPTLYIYLELVNIRPKKDGPMCLRIGDVFNSLAFHVSCACLIQTRTTAAHTHTRTHTHTHNFLSTITTSYQRLQSQKCKVNNRKNANWKTLLHRNSGVAIGCAECARHTGPRPPAGGPQTPHSYIFVHTNTGSRD